MPSSLEDSSYTYWVVIFHFCHHLLLSHDLQISFDFWSRYGLQNLKCHRLKKHIQVKLLYICVQNLFTTIQMWASIWMQQGVLHFPASPFYFLFNNLFFTVLSDAFQFTKQVYSENSEFFNLEIRETQSFPFHKVR